MQNDAATIPNYVELTSDVVSAYVSKNSVSRTDLEAVWKRVPTGGEV